MVKGIHIYIHTYRAGSSGTGPGKVCVCPGRDACLPRRRRSEEGTEDGVPFSPSHRT